MKTNSLFLALLFTISLLASPSAFGTAGCEESSWNPSLYSFYGAKDKILEKLQTIPGKLSDRRVFVQITQGKDSAQVKFYEKSGNSYSVTEWTIADASELTEKIDKSIMANKGVNCVGEQVKEILSDELKNGKTFSNVPAPASAMAAFAHGVKEASGDFIKTTIIILC